MQSLRLLITRLIERLIERLIKRLIGLLILYFRTLPFDGCH